jgi:hypothetical protein
VLLSLLLGADLAQREIEAHINELAG